MLEGSLIFHWLFIDYLLLYWSKLRNGDTQYFLKESYLMKESWAITCPLDLHGKRLRHW